MDKGQWNLRADRGGDLAFQEAGRAGAFTIVSFARTNQGNVGKFKDMLTRMARDRGMELGQYREARVDATNWKRGGGPEVERILEDVARSLGLQPLDLIICIMDDNQTMNGKELYPAIKRWSHTVSNIATQCVQQGKACGKLMSNPQYYAGLLLKINLKLNGVNVIAPEGLALLRAEPTIVFGVDVNHAQAGGDQPSFAALVATMDAECARYFTSVHAKPPREEICDLKEPVRKALRQFREANGVAPKRIVFYRDGVAHNQFAKVAEQEISLIRQACLEEGGDDYVPKLLFIIVQQRTRARFATPNFQQCSAGTVIDSGIVGEQGKDFYMISQHGLKGTARPCHYHIIADDIGVTVDEVQRLTFDFCFLYARATKIVSRPAPVYYAHRAAFLARYYEQGFREVGDAWETSSVASAGSRGSGASARSIPEISLGEPTAKTVYFA
jgi:hypothetical protein